MSSNQETYVYSILYHTFVFCDYFSILFTYIVYSIVRLYYLISSKI